MNSLKDTLDTTFMKFKVAPSHNNGDYFKGFFLAGYEHGLESQQKRIDNLLAAVEKGELFRNRIKLLKNQSVLPSDYLENDIFIFDKALEKDKQL